LFSASQPSSEEQVQVFLHCLQSAVPLFKRGGDSAAFVDFYLAKVLPVLAQLPVDKALAISQNVCDVLRYLSPAQARPAFDGLLAAFTRTVPKAGEAKAAPVPSAAPTESKEGEEASPTATPTASDASKLNYSLVECLLAMFHQAAAKQPDLARSLVGGSAAAFGQPVDTRTQTMEAKRDDFQARLKFVAAQCKEYTPKLLQAQKNIRMMISSADKTEEEKKALGDKRNNVDNVLRAMGNISKLIEALTKKDATFLGDEAAAMGSWHAGGKSADKRKRGGAEAKEGTPVKKTQQLYQAPKRQGKAKAQTDADDESAPLDSALTAPRRGRGAAGAARGRGGRKQASQKQQQQQAGGGRGGRRGGATARGSNKRGGRGGRRN